MLSPCNAEVSKKGTLYFSDLFIPSSFDTSLLSEQQFNINYTGLVETTFQVYKVNQKIKFLVEEFCKILSLYIEI